MFILFIRDVIYFRQCVNVDAVQHIVCTACRRVVSYVQRLSGKWEHVSLSLSRLRVKILQQRNVIRDGRGAGLTIPFGVGTSDG